MIVTLEQNDNGVSFDFTYNGVNHIGYEQNVFDTSMKEILTNRILDEIYSWLLNKGISKNESLTTTNKINLIFKII